MATNNQEKSVQGIVLTLRSEDKKEQDFELISVEGQGTSTTCYIAKKRVGKDSSCIGYLKRISYDVDSYVQHFLKIRTRTQNLKVHPGKSISLKNHVQTGEVYYDKNPKRKVAYIWSEGVDGRRFDRSLADACETNYLGDLLKVIHEIGEVMNEIHNNGMMYLDLKPENMILADAVPERLDCKWVSFFDTDSFCFAGDKEYAPKFTEHFAAPELMNGNYEMSSDPTKADIYSLGCLLYYAIRYEKNSTEDYFDVDRDYDNLREKVIYSHLFQQYEENAPLIAPITTLLKAMLAKNPSDRYEWRGSQTETEQKSLEEQIAAMIEKISHYHPGNPKNKTVIEPTVMIQNLLRQHPLYEVCKDPKQNLNVLVFGTGLYGQKFADICLQNVQNLKNYCTITLLSDNAEMDKSEYLDARRALHHFVCIDEPKKPGSYGSLRFKKLKKCGAGNNEFQPIHSKDPKHANANNQKINDKMLTGIFKNLGTSFEYVFISLGSDLLNRAIADSVYKKLKAVNPQVIVAYVAENKRRKAVAEGEKAHLIPVVPVEDTPQVNDTELERLAFNVNLSYANDLSENPEKAFKDLKKNNYNYLSSLNSAMSIPYKLHTIGIDCSDSEQMQAANAFRKIQNPDNIRLLIDMEHHRWNLEKVTQGWSAPYLQEESTELDLSQNVLLGAAKNESMLLHSCLVDSNVSSQLDSVPDTKWDEEGYYPENCDELDRMSLNLHRACAAYAKEQKDLRDSLREKLKVAFEALNISSREEDIWDAFKMYLFAIDHIEFGNKGYSKKYSKYAGEFSKKLQDRKKPGSEKVLEYLDQLQKAYKPLIEANLYHDYKKSDADLVKNIPFILTYRPIERLAVVFHNPSLVETKNDELFKNVAAATILCPTKELIYLYHCTKEQTPELLQKRLTAIMDYFRMRGLQMSFRFLALCDADTTSMQKTYLNRLKEQLAGRMVVERVDCDNVDTGIEAITKRLQEAAPVIMEADSSLYTSPLQAMKFIQSVTDQQIPCFEFDTKTKQFTNCLGCEYLQYINTDSAAIHVTEMFALMNANGTHYRSPEYADCYMALWKLYTGWISVQMPYGTKTKKTINSWNNLCADLEEYHKRNDELCKLEVFPQATLPNRQQYYLRKVGTGWTSAIVQTTLRNLAEYHLIAKDFSIAENKDCITVTLKTNDGNQKELEKIFTNRWPIVGNFQFVKRKEYTKEFVSVSTSSLEVFMTVDEKKASEYDAILHKLESPEFLFITNYHYDQKGGPISFTYWDESKKHLMTNAGELLEVFAFFKAIDLHYFDDVVTSWAFDWSEGQVSNELDLVVTKGFRSAFVECKSVLKLDMNYYHKLESLTKRFGIGAIPVLLANTHADPGTEFDDINHMQITRGDQMGIRTINDAQQIENFGETLKNLFE